MKQCKLLILFSVCCLMAPPTQAKSASSQITDQEFGYLDFELESHEPGIQCIPKLQSKIQTISGSVSYFDEILCFKLKETSGKLYKSLDKTIACNPGKILTLLLRRKDKLEEVELKIKSSHSPPAVSREQEIKARYFLDEERTFRPIPRSAFKDFGNVPEFVELFNDKIGPSPMLLRPRLLGLRALSLPYKSREAQSILQALALPLTPTLIYIESNDRGGTITSDLEMLQERLKIEAFAANIRRQLVRLNNLRNASQITYPQGNSGRLVTSTEWSSDQTETVRYCNHTAPPLIVGTWPGSQKNVANSGMPSLEERTKLDKVCQTLIKSINSSSLDLPSTRLKLQGEAALEGNSLLAGNQELASFYPIEELASSPEETIFTSDKTAVAKVRHGASFHYSYLFFQKSDSWKLTAIRTPCWNRTTADLCLQPDKSLIAWFNRNKKQLFALKPLLQNATDISSSPVCAQQLVSFSTRCERLWEVARNTPTYLPNALSWLFPRHENGELEQKLHELGFTSASQSPRTNNSYYLNEAQTPDGNFYLELPSPNCSTAYIIFSPKDNPPDISPNGFIWLKKLDPHWYLARSAS